MTQYTAKKALKERHKRKKAGVVNTTLAEKEMVGLSGTPRDRDPELEQLEAIF